MQPMLRKLPLLLVPIVIYLILLLPHHAVDKAPAVLPVLAQGVGDLCGEETPCQAMDTHVTAGLRVWHRRSAYPYAHTIQPADGTPGTTSWLVEAVYAAPDDAPDSCECDSISFVMTFDVTYDQATGDWSASNCNGVAGPCGVVPAPFAAPIITAADSCSGFYGHLSSSYLISLGLEEGQQLSCSSDLFTYYPALVRFRTTSIEDEARRVNIGSPCNFADFTLYAPKRQFYASDDPGPFECSVGSGTATTYRTRVIWYGPMSNTPTPPPTITATPTATSTPTATQTPTNTSTPSPTTTPTPSPTPTAATVCDSLALDPDVVCNTCEAPTDAGATMGIPHVDMLYYNDGGPHGWIIDFIATYKRGATAVERVCRAKTDGSSGCQTDLPDGSVTLTGSPQWSNPPRNCQTTYYDGYSFHGICMLSYIVIDGERYDLDKREFKLWAQDSVDTFDLYTADPGLSNCSRTSDCPQPPTPVALCTNPDNRVIRLGLDTISTLHFWFHGE